MGVITGYIKLPAFISNMTLSHQATKMYLSGYIACFYYIETKLEFLIYISNDSILIYMAPTGDRKQIEYDMTFEIK